MITDLLPSHGTEWDVIFANSMRYFDSNQEYGEHYDKFAYRDHIIHWNPTKGVFYERGHWGQLGENR